MVHTCASRTELAPDQICRLFLLSLTAHKIYTRFGITDAIAVHLLRTSGFSAEEAAASLIAAFLMTGAAVDTVIR